LTLKVVFAAHGFARLPSRLHESVALWSVRNSNFAFVEVVLFGGFFVISRVGAV
jgi:hypothetical protein